MFNSIKMNILSLKERDRIRDRWLLERVNELLPILMKKHKVESWILVGREYNEDPVLETFFPSAIDSSSRLTILFVTMVKGHFEKYILNANPNYSDYYELGWDFEEETQMEALKRLVEQKKPKNIGLNYGNLHAVTDGLTSSLYTQIMNILGESYKDKVISAEGLSIDWLQIRTNSELNAYPHIAELARFIAKEALSNTVIHPGVTNTQEVVEWIRQRVVDLGLDTSFYPTVDIQREGEKRDRLEGVTILPGDVIHLDFGIRYLGLTTDTQQLAYVLKQGEKKPPRGLNEGLKTALHLEEIIEEQFIAGCSGNDIFSGSMEKAKELGIKAMIYSHPLGYHCHGAGPLIGLYDQQNEIQGRGELPIEDNTCYAMEFNIRKFVPEWNQVVTFYLEEPVVFTSGQLYYLATRQKEFYLIK
ncbi:Xaa-Pro aminopeptidase [Bacillus pakistanensis]|uniref:Xaa-Pro aminopeptidase n=1 Tax=Rossellomorea pakistanensis TaxID=992288 RepID=A0ABS2N8A4_9BACI|nr:M24 family metallopeptidase [Bacillus pakistanensis]MBM7584053.1 Xaa-Pro aminopeptidase [Bacillus pakistanensis]